MFYLFKTIGVLLLIYVDMKDKVNWALVLSVVAVVLGIIAICNVYPRNLGFGMDYQGWITGVLAILVTALIGWQIYSSVSIEKRMEQKIGQALETHSDNIKKRIYINIVSIYSLMYLEASKNMDIAGMILYNDMKITPAIYSKEEKMAKDIISNAEYIVSLVNKETTQKVLEKLKNHSERLKELCKEYPSIVDEYLIFRNALLGLS